MNAEVLSTTFLCGCPGCVCTSERCGLSLASDGSKYSMVCAAKLPHTSKQGGICTTHWDCPRPVLSSLELLAQTGMGQTI